jgi:hypothetical protein
MNRCDVLSKKSFLIEKMYKVLISHFIMLSEIVSIVNLHCQAFSGLQLQKQPKEKKKKELGTGLPHTSVNSAKISHKSSFNR